MRRRCGCILCLLLLGLSACENKTLNQTEEEHSNVITVSEEEITENSYTENSNEALSSESIREEDTSGILDIQQYSNASIYFEYPVEWVLTEQQGEDGTCVSISNPNEEDSADFILVQGEAWCVNLDYAKEDYVQLLSEKYEALEITDLSTIIIDGYDAKKLQFTFKDNEQKYVGTKYMVIAELVSFEITYVYPSEKAEEYERQGESIFKSMKFTMAKTAAQQAFLSVLLSKDPFLYTNKYVGQNQDELYVYNGYLNQLSFNGKTLVIPRFSIVDMDGDNIPEIVLEMEEYQGFIVLRYKDGEILGNEFGYRWLIGLREDGSSRGSSGATDYSMGKLYFVNDTFVYSERLRMNNTSYYFYDVPVDEKTWNELGAIYDETPKVEWYDFSIESIKKHIIDSPLFVEIPQETKVKMKERQTYIDSLEYLLELTYNYTAKDKKVFNAEAKKYYYCCKEEMDKIYNLCSAKLLGEEVEALEGEQQFWQKCINTRLENDLLAYNVCSIDELKEQTLYFTYGDMILRRILRLINFYYDCHFYD